LRALDNAGWEQMNFMTDLLFINDF